MNDGTRVTALWHTTINVPLRLYWNTTLKKPVIYFPGAKKPLAYDRYPMAAQKLIDDAVSFAGHGINAAAASQGHTLRTPLEVEMQFLQGIAANGMTTYLPIFSVTDIGRHVLDDTWQKIVANNARNEPMRELQRVRRSAEDAKEAAEDARRAARDMEWELQTLPHKLRGLGLIP
jgi:hypothetical protein